MKNIQKSNCKIVFNYFSNLYLMAKFNQTFRIIESKKNIRKNIKYTLKIR